VSTLRSKIVHRTDKAKFELRLPDCKVRPHTSDGAAISTAMGYNFVFLSFIHHAR
jgi:hypothetical protein